MGLVSKVSANLTSLRFCEETSLGVLDPTPANQTWRELEPNSYADFGGKTTVMPRTPILADRQRRKGVVVNLEAMGGFNVDLTQTNLQLLLQSFFFAALRRKAEFTATVTAVATADDSYAGSSINTNYRAGDLIFCAGFTNSANNGLHVVASVSSGKVLVSENLVNETPPASGTSIVAVGFQFASADAAIDASGTLPVLTTVVKDMTELGIVPGEWVFIGGDSSTLKFATAANNGFARVRSVAAHAMTFDKTAGTMVTDTGTGKTVQLFMGRVLKNETGASIVRKSVTLERLLAYSNDSDTTKEQAEYLSGQVGNQLTIAFRSADKVTVDLSFVGTASSTRDENDSVDLLSKVSGVVRVASLGEDAYNTASDISRAKLALVSNTTAITPLLAYVKELTLTVNNNVKPDNALGVLGAFDLTTGTFEVGGSITGYYNQTDVIAARDNNSDATFDLHLFHNNTGISIDVPLIAIDNARLAVAKDEEVTIPLDTPAAIGSKIVSTYTHTLLMVFWDYLPSLAT